MRVGGFRRSDMVVFPLPRWPHRNLKSTRHHGTWQPWRCGQSTLFVAIEMGKTMGTYGAKGLFTTRFWGGLKSFRRKHFWEGLWVFLVVLRRNAMNIGEKSSTDRPQPGTVGATVDVKSDKPPIWDGWNPKKLMGLTTYQLVKDFAATVWWAM